MIIDDNGAYDDVKALRALNVWHLLCSRVWIYVPCFALNTFSVKTQQRISKDYVVSQ